MSCPTNRNVLLAAAVAAAAIVCLPPEAGRACGPFFPPTVLHLPDQAVLQAPLGEFRVELARLGGEIRAPFRSVGSDKTPSAQTAEADLADLTAALAGPGLSAPRRRKLIGQYAAARQELCSYADRLSEWRSWSRYRRKKRSKSPPPAPAVPDLPEAIPEEFRLYVRGAYAFHGGDRQAAVDLWSRLLELPEKRRRYRSTWAAYMIARVCEADQPDKAVRWFGHVRKLAAAGFADSLGLAAASYGWQGRAELDRKRFARAIDLYLLHRAAGAGSAVPSLRIVAARLLAAGGEHLEAAAAHAPTRRVVAAHLVSSTARWGVRAYHGSDEQTKQVAAWLAAVESAGVKDVAGADRLAWAAYQAGEMTAADRWLRRAPATAPMARWLRAKLLVRDGKLDRADAALAAAVAALPAGQGWPQPSFPAQNCEVRDRAAAELAALRVARGRYVEALDLLLRAAFWFDAAYLAERVLTPDELIAYVDRHWSEPRVKPARTTTAWGFGETTPAERAWMIRHLLARRLTRLGRWKDARKYYPPGLRKPLDEYIAGIRAGADPGRLQAERAQSLFKAARIARHRGMELLAAELEPDWHVCEGSFELLRASKSRLDPSHARLVVVTADERARLGRHRPQPDKRFHYRYVAADHAWAAARLMPDESDCTARMLCEAGTWLKTRDPKAADRFYKALVRRCGTTELGRQADRLRWFPKLDGG